MTTHEILLEAFHLGAEGRAQSTVDELEKKLTDNLLHVVWGEDHAILDRGWKGHLFTCYRAEGTHWHPGMASLEITDKDFEHHMGRIDPTWDDVWELLEQPEIQELIREAD